MTRLDVSQPLSPGQVAEIKESLDQIQLQGAAGVPAIAEFLARNQDIDFADAKGNSPVGTSSLRASLLDALSKIGGSAAQQVMVDTLRTTADPAEIGLLGKHLEDTAPGQYRQELVAAAREALDQALKGDAPVRDFGPLFDTLRKFGDGEVISDLERALPRWGHYAAIALAGLPGGEGIPVLAQQIQNESARKPEHYLFSFQLLAQVAGQYPAAGAALIEAAQQGQIPDEAWRQMAQGFLSEAKYEYGRPGRKVPRVSSPGDRISAWTTYNASGTAVQIYNSPPLYTESADVIQNRLGVIEQLLAGNSNPAAVKELDEARAALANGRN
jgi:hypothetical protein